MIPRAGGMARAHVVCRHAQNMHRAYIGCSMAIDIHMRACSSWLCIMSRMIPNESK